MRRGLGKEYQVVVVTWRETGLTAKVATDGKQELITVISSISGDERGLVDGMVVGEYKFAYPRRAGLTGLEWGKNFHAHTVKQAKGGYRWLSVDGHDSVVNVGFSLPSNVIVYRLPSHSTQLLQSLDVGLFSLVQKHYGKQFDQITRYIGYKGELSTYVGRSTTSDIQSLQNK